jgi:hypothetical protein
MLTVLCYLKAPACIRVGQSAGVQPTVSRPKKKEIEKYFDKKKKKLGAHYYPAVATYGISTHTHKKRGRDDL